jgi:hypothetical protein
MMHDSETSIKYYEKLSHWLTFTYCDFKKFFLYILAQTQKSCDKSL